MIDMLTNLAFTDLKVVIEDETSSVEYARYDVHKCVLMFESAFLADYLTEYPDLESVKLTVPNKSYVDAAKDLLRSAYGAEVEFTPKLVELVLKFQFKRCARDMCVCKYKYFDDDVEMLAELDKLCMLASGESLWNIEDCVLKETQEKILDRFYRYYAYKPSWDNGKLVDYLCNELSFRSMYAFLKRKDDGQSCMDGDAILVAKWYEHHNSERTCMVDLMELIDVFRLTPSYRSWWVDYILMIDETHTRSIIKDVSQGCADDINVWKGERKFKLKGRDMKCCCFGVTAEKYMPNLTFEYDCDAAYLGVCFINDIDRLKVTFDKQLTIECMINVKMSLMSSGRRQVLAVYEGAKKYKGKNDVSFGIEWDFESISLKDNCMYILVCEYEFVYNV